MSEVTINYKGSSIATLDVSSTKTLLTEGKYCEDDIVIEYNRPVITPNLQAKTYTVDSAGTETITADSGYDGLSEVEVSVPSASPFMGNSGETFVTEGGQRKWKVNVFTEVNVSEGDMEGWLPDGYHQDFSFTKDAVPSNTSVTPTESAQTIGGYDYMMEGAVTVNAIPSNYVGSGITQRSSSDLTASGDTVVVPSGYYSAQASKAVASGSAGTPTATKGTVSNHQVSVTPSVTNTSGYISGGTKTGTAVTVTASELASGNKAITQNGTDIDVVGYSTVSVDVQGGGGGGGEPASKKQINFIDYDGTILHSYTSAEWQSVTALPSNPSHTGLTAQGWNWTKVQIDAQLTAMPDDDVWVGQMYITDDGKTRIYIHLEDGRLHPYLGIGLNGTAVIDWGDNSATSTLTGTSLTTAYHADHTYTSDGDYMITITASSGSFSIFGVSQTSHILKKDTQATAYVNRVYTNAVQRVELGANAQIGAYAFNYCTSLSSITIPDGVTRIGANVFNYCYSLSSITIPDGVTRIGIYAFQNCTSLSSITIPDGVTSIGNYAFSACHGMAEYHIKPTTPPTLLNKNAFTNIQSDCVIYVPSASLEAYQIATNWSTYASNMQGE